MCCSDVREFIHLSLIFSINLLIQFTLTGLNGDSFMIHESDIFNPLAGTIISK